MKIKRLIFVSACAVILLSSCATILVRQLNRWKSGNSPDPASTEMIWTAISCRASLYLHKAEGKFPELSWSEIWGLSQPGTGFKCGEGGSLEASVQFSSMAG